MVYIAYTPTSEYKKEYNTPSTKTPLISTLMLFGKRITHYNVGADPATDIYEVPIGKTFFLVACSQTNTVIASIASSIIFIDTATPTTGGLSYITSGATSVTNYFADSKSFPIPLRLQSGEKIKMSALSGNTALGMIEGYEIDNSFLNSVE